MSITTKIILSSVLGLFIALQSNASVFPNDAKTAYYSFTGNLTNYILIPYTNKSNTILYVAYNVSTGDATATLNMSCGVTTLLAVKNFNYNANLDRFDSRVCTSDVLVSTVGLAVSAVSSVRVIYTNYDLTLVPSYQVVLASISIPLENTLDKISSKSLDILPVYSSMTAGDLAIILCLFVLIMLQFLMFFFRKNKIN
jgi:hypothetical protein